MHSIIKKRYIAGTSVLIAGAVAGVMALSSPQSAHATDSPLTTEVSNQSKELANHEARITNTESNVADLQAKTGTPASSTQTVVPDADPNPAQTPDPTPVPVTVVSYQQIPLDDQGNTDCQYTYSDGTTYQWHWKTYNPQGSWQVNGNPLNGYHWVPTTSTSGTCDDSVIGWTK